MVHPRTFSKFLVKKTNPLEICGWKQGKYILLCNGHLYYEDNYVNGKLHGLCRTWYENGPLFYEHNYVNGIKHGLCRGWNSNGQLSYEHNYINGV